MQPINYKCVHWLIYCDHEPLWLLTHWRWSLFFSVHTGLKIMESRSPVRNIFRLDKTWFWPLKSWILNIFFCLWNIELHWQQIVLNYIDVQVFGGKLMKNSCRCFWVPFCGFRRFSCPFFLEYHHVVVSESLQGSSHICISVKLDLFRQRSPQRRNVAKYLWKRDLARNLFHKQHVYHPKLINIQQSFHLGRLATLYRERIINVNRNLH